MKKLISTILLFIFLISTPLSADTYRLQSGDTLQIEVRNKSELNTKQVITPDGTVSLPIMGRLKVQNMTLHELDAILKTEYAKYVQAPVVVAYLIPKTAEVEKPKPTKPIYITQHNLSTNTWQTHKAETVEEARALAGPNFSPTANIEPGQVIQVEMGKRPDWFEKNWYRVITATILVTGFVVSRK